MMEIVTPIDRYRYREGEIAFAEWGDDPRQNPYIVGPGREREAMLWWRGFSDVRTLTRREA